MHERNEKESGDSLVRRWVLMWKYCRKIDKKQLMTTEAVLNRGITWGLFSNAPLIPEQTDNDDVFQIDDEPLSQ